jgi:hypothetical protein
MLYSQQADPDDPPLTPPKDPQHRRQDTVYLDTWTEPVTFVEDPWIRHVALGGPDTATRLVVRHKVRIAEGADAPPTGNGVGDGRLSTHGSYTGLTNRYYRVEIDRQGDIGSATFRWSEDNASSIGRVTSDIPAGGKTVTVEDASLFQVGDRVLIRNANDTQENAISSLAGNAIELVSASTAFSLASKPRIERWNAFGVETEIDQQNPAFSKVIALNDGVALQFSGKNFVRGDYWLFTARQLAKPSFTAGVSDGSVELLDCARPKGIVHHFAPLATLIRDGSNPDAALVDTIDDLRVSRTVVNVDVTDTPPELPDFEHELKRVQLPDLRSGTYLVRLSGVGTRCDLIGLGGATGPTLGEMSACSDVGERLIRLAPRTGPPVRSPFEIVAVVSAAPLKVLGLTAVPLSLRISVTRITPQKIGLSAMRLAVLELMAPIADRFRPTPPLELR